MGTVNIDLLFPYSNVQHGARVRKQSYLPDVARMAADQFDNFACVADGSVCEQEEQAGVSTEHRLPQDPVERRQDVGPPHVGSDLPDILTSQGQSLLNHHGEEEKI